MTEDLAMPPAAEHDGDDHDSRIAIVGMVGRYPGAPDLDSYWRNLAAGSETVRRLTPADVVPWGQDPAVLDDPEHVTRYGILDGADLFDATFFGYSPREAELMDPQHRVFLESAWEALEHAGYDAATYTGRIGVYAGCRSNLYASIVRDQRTLFPLIDEYQLAIGTAVDFLTTRVSYKVGLTGPSETILTTCSTSLVAIHQACQALLGGECDIALSGGVAVRIPQISMPFREGGVIARDGHCRTFDADAHGTVVGDGVGVVVLKRLPDAVADRDTIHAVILGSAVNNDGPARMGFTAPSVEGQTAVIRAAHDVAGIDPASVTYVEAHGTGTPLGDPIEVAALTAAFRAGTDRTGYCGLGSVKTNIGHTDAAAGVAGLLKVVLSMQAGLLPPSLHFTTPNPEIPFGETPFFVNTEPRKWEASGGRRRAGVSSFGMGGTNAHAVLEEAPIAAPTGPALPRHLLPLSARTQTALDAAARNLAAHLRERPESSLADVAYTLQVGRRAMPERRFVVCADRDEAMRALTGTTADRATVPTTGAPVRVTLMFPGQGGLRVPMIHQLYRTFGSFRHDVDTLCDAVEAEVRTPLRPLLLPEPSRVDAAAEQLRRTEYNQPALFVVEYALARLLTDLGVRPTALIGHSLGEYVAACLAGVFTPEDVVRLLAARGRLVQGTPTGAMLAVPLREEDLAPRLDPTVALAAVNGPERCVVSGPPDAVKRLADSLAEDGVPTRRLTAGHAFHSHLLDPVLDEFTGLVEGMVRRPPSIPFVSNLTGTWVTADEAVDAAYWTSQLRRTVRFGAGIGTLLREPDGVFVEVGFGGVLGSLVRSQSATGGRPLTRVLRTLGNDGESDVDTLLRTVGGLWTAGTDIAWERLHDHGRRRVPLPTYPFERQRYMVYPAPARTDTDRAALNREPAPAGPAHRDGVEHDVTGSVALIFEEVLGVTDLGPDSDFFDLGGDSLSAAQLVARVREVFLVPIELTTVFEEPTVAGLARAIDALAADRPGAADDDIYQLG